MMYKYCPNCSKQATINKGRYLCATCGDIELLMQQRFNKLKQEVKEGQDKIKEEIQLEKKELKEEEKTKRQFVRTK